MTETTRQAMRNQQLRRDLKFLFGLGESYKLDLMMEMIEDYRADMDRIAKDGR